MSEYPLTEDPFYDDAWLEETFGPSKRTWERKRQEGTGPRFITVGRRVLYRLSDIEEWLRQNTFTSTAEAAAAKERDAAESVRRYEERERAIAGATAEAARRCPRHKRRREATGQAKEASD
jgi:predicted DNA-binding transcriptional regulator AlpA